jgi:hypothetical protein
MIQSDEIKLPAEFQASLYENLIQPLQKKGGFQHVYREGDRTSAGVPNLIVLHSTVRGFKQGSEMARQVITVAGATSISVHCEFMNPGGQVLLARDIKGNVRFFGGNLNATSDFAKKAASVARANVSPVNGSRQGAARVGSSPQLSCIGCVEAKSIVYLECFEPTREIRNQRP